MIATGAKTITRLIERQGPALHCGHPGRANLPLYDALARSGNLLHILATQGAVQKLHDVRDVKVLREKDVAVFRGVGCFILPVEINS